ncbi:MAG TPA: amidase family protein, partial [Blastocatellia bacterium]|nr:amidase family protein [Blastocatellia bacterium]
MDQTRRDFLAKAFSFSLATAGGSLFTGRSAFASQAKTAFSDLASYDAIGMAELIRKKQVSPLELIDDVIRRIERINPKINAVLTKNFDIERARDRARAGAGDGMFAGAPVMLKNLTRYKDARIDSGSRLFAQIAAKMTNPGQGSSPLVEAIEKAGMIVTGITNSPELGLLETTEPVLHGPTRNPWNPAFTAGGSSGGTAAAIA